ncbi:hypothetical protein LZP85_02300 [Priestia flexa]|jgi:DNA-binding transcriptional regulator GbsR (MarR family)|uniref:Uncharacterized protein n=2 Tax=Priestia TaxID=2800373 RepID=A0A0V8JNL6_9BACI|nr:MULTISPECIES: hypothetical protein [Bacillaceae]OZT11215.1 hypothetical protein CHN50_17580 [Priestia aryabhattai]USY55803.1 hypothetical protein NIZ91_03865 [Bacillus sp. 1780r2a1]KSU88192.1 hypothetical protein AS180_09170 [Priestia veravalensis]KZB91991.1 hypothetical protein A2U94_07790 [Bacillus sp. VT 712]MBN8251169.1 hypothetical protein [Priestia flexa]
MKEHVERVYDEAYDFIDQALQQIRSVECTEEADDEIKEKRQRTEIALQAARDILENMIIPGKKLTFIYENGSVVVEIPEK